MWCLIYVHLKNKTKQPNNPLLLKDDTLVALCCCREKGQEVCSAYNRSSHVLSKF